MNSAKLKETIAKIVKEESEYQLFFRKALEKAGKSITDMSDEEKKVFFNKIDAAWDGKGEKNEELVGNQHKLDVDGDGEIEASDLAALRAGKKKDESVTEGKKVFRVNPAIGKAKYSISSHDGVKKHKDGSDFFDIEIFKNKVDLEKAIKNYTSKGFVKESVNEGKDDFVARHGKANIILKKGYKHHNDTDLEKLYDKLGSLVKGLKVKDVTLVFESVNEVKVGQMVKVVDNPHWEAALGKKGPFKRKVKGIYGDSVFFTDGSNSDMKYIKESVNEGVSPKDMEKIKGAVEAASSFMGIGSELKKLGIRYIFATSPMPVYIVQPTPNNKVAIVNKKYATKPDFVVGDTAVGVMENLKLVKEPKSINEFNVNKKFGSKYDIGAGSMGNGTTFWNRAEEEFGDYKKIAHVSDNGVVKFYDKTLPGNVKKHIEDYAKTQKESVNEAASRTAMEIGGLTGMNKDAIQKFVDEHNLDIEKLYQYVKKGKLKERMEFVSAVVGNPGNKIQKMIISKFGIKESVNELKKGSVVIPYAHDKYGEFIVDKVFKNKDGETSYTGKFKKSGEAREFILHSKDRVVKESVNELKKLQNGNFSIKKGYNTFTDYEKNAKPGDTILKYDKRGGMIKTFVSGSELHQNAKKYLSKVHSIVGDKVNLSLFGKQGIATVPDYEKKDIGVLVLESINEGRAFINAARKAKQEGKTEFEFNGKKYPVTLKEGTLNEMNPQLNKAVKTLLDKELKGMRPGGGNHYFAVMNVLMGALTDANFHSESKKVPAIFGSKAKYEGDPMGKRDMENLYQSIGEKIATMAKWDGEDIAKAVGFYVSMTVGRPTGEKIEKLV